MYWYTSPLGRAVSVVWLHHQGSIETSHRIAAEMSFQQRSSTQLELACIHLLPSDPKCRHKYLPYMAALRLKH